MISHFIGEETEPLRIKELVQSRTEVDKSRIRPKFVLSTVITCRKTFFVTCTSKIISLTSEFLSEKPS